jgi:hypothetical protein
MDVDVPSLSLRTLTILGTLGDEWVDDLPPESEPKQGIKPHPTTTITPTPSSTSTELKLELEPQPDQASRKKQPRTSGKKIIKNGGKKVLFQYPAVRLSLSLSRTLSDQPTNSKKTDNSPPPPSRAQQGKMTAHHFITVSWPVHLVIQQGQGNGTRTLMEFDLKPREYRTG